MWRADDEALLRQLDDEVLFERLWSEVAPGAAPLHPRAAGIIDWLRRSADWPPVGKAVAMGDLRPLRALTNPPSLKGREGELLHHLALFHAARVATISAQVLARGGHPEAPAQRALEEAMGYVVAAWLALGAEQTYLTHLVAHVFRNAKGAPPTDELALRGIRAIAARAASWNDAPLCIPLQVLRRIEVAVAMAGVDGPLAEAARRCAARESDRIIASRLDPFRAQLDAVAARNWTGPEARDLFARLRNEWEWSGEDVELEHLMVTEVPRFAWDLYRDKKWAELRALLAPIEVPTDQLQRRIERDPAQLAWAAACAQVLIFRAELAPTLDAQVALAERGHRTCPSLRNARLVLADLLCARAERRLETPVLLRRSEAHDEASADVERAESLYPELRRLAQIKRKLHPAAAR